MTTTYKAVIRVTHGEFREVLSVGQFELPTIAKDFVLVKVHAASVNPIDAYRISGAFKERIIDDFPVVDGCDFAGVVTEVGSEVQDFKVGDEVYGNSHVNGMLPQKYGAWGEYTIAHENWIAHKPKSLSFVEAGSLGVVAGTALEAFEKGNLHAKTSPSVLILGGAGGVGTQAIQLAKALYSAAFVATTASKEKHELVLSLGADVAIDYKTHDFVTELGDKRFDLVLDTTHEAQKAKALVKEDGVVVTIVGPQGEDVIFFAHTSGRDRLEKLAAAYDAGKVRALVEKTFPLEQVVDALEAVKSRRTVGKVVLQIA